MIRSGVTGAFGPALRRALAAGARNRAAAFAAGFGVTGVLQSSTATALIVASFVGRGIVGAAAGLAIMLGADVGTTVMPQLLSFDLGWLAPLFLVAGVPLYLTARPSRWRQGGRVVVALGLLLLALRLIVSVAEPLRDSEFLRAVTVPLAGEPFLALLLGAALAWLMHSSLAVVLLVMSFAATGALAPVPAFALVLGANVGGGVPPLILAAGDGAAARRVPLGNLLVRVVGALAGLALLRAVAPALAALDPDPARQVANFHTGFNIVLAAVFLPFVGRLAAVVERLVADNEPGTAPDRPRYLDPAALEVPSEALAGAARETLRMGDQVEAMLRRSIEVFRDDDERLLDEITAMDDVVDHLHEAIKLYLIEVSRAPLSEEEGRRYVEILTFTINLEHIGDIIDKSLMELAAKKIREGVSFSPEGFKEICDIHAAVVQNMGLALNVFMTFDVGLARRLLNEKVAIRNAELSATERHLARLRAGQPETMETSSLHLDVIRDLRRINSHVTSAAYPILEVAGELEPSRLR